MVWTVLFLWGGRRAKKRRRNYEENSCFIMEDKVISSYMHMNFIFNDIVLKYENLTVLQKKISFKKKKKSSMELNPCFFNFYISWV